MTEVKRWKATERPGLGKVVEVVDAVDYEKLCIKAENMRIALEMHDKIERETNAKNEQMRELLRLAGIVAQHARVIVGGRDFTTGAHVSPCGIYSLASNAEALRDALDNYDKAVVEATK